MFAAQQSATTSNVFERRHFALYDGVNDYSIFTGGLPGYEQSGDYTISMWVKCWGGNMFTWWKGNGRLSGGAEKYHNIIIDKNSIASSQWINADHDILVSGTTSQDMDGADGNADWHNYVISHDRDSFVKVYFDGVEADTYVEQDESKDGMIENTTYSPANCRWTVFGVGVFFLDGSISEQVVYGKALTEEEVKYQYNNGEAFDHENSKLTKDLKHWFTYGDGLGFGVDNVYDDTNKRRGKGTFNGIVGNEEQHTHSDSPQGYN